MSVRVQRLFGWGMCGLSFAIYVVSLFNVAFFLDRPPPGDAHMPLGIVLLGWLGVMGVLDGDFQALGWLANPCWALGMIGLLSRNHRLAAGFGGAAVLIAPLSLLLKKMTINEAGHTADVVRFGPGFYFWIAALGVQFIAALILFAKYETADVTQSVDEDG